MRKMKRSSCRLLAYLSILIVTDFFGCTQNIEHETWKCQGYSSGIEIRKRPHERLFSSCNQVLEITCRDSLEFFSFEEVSPIRQRCYFCDLSDCKLLTTGAFDGYQDIEIARELCSLDRLSYLNFTNCSSHAIPECIYGMPNVIEIYINFLADSKELDFKKGNSAVKRLSILHSELEAIPSGIQFFLGLEELRLGGNEIRYLPRFLGEMPHLQQIDLFDNPICDDSLSQGQNIDEMSLQAFHKEFSHIKLITRY